MDNSALIYLVDSVLGHGKSSSKGNKAYHCPECKHHKLKLEINQYYGKNLINKNSTG